MVVGGGGSVVVGAGGTVSTGGPVDTGTPVVAAIVGSAIVTSGWVAGGVEIPFEVVGWVTVFFRPKNW